MTQARPALVNDPTQTASPPAGGVAAGGEQAPARAAAPAVSPELLEKLKSTPIGVDEALDKQRLEVLMALTNAQAVQMQAIASSLAAGSPVAGKLPAAAAQPAEPPAAPAPAEPAPLEAAPPAAAAGGEPAAPAPALPFAAPLAAAPPPQPQPTVAAAAMPLAPPLAPSAASAALPFAPPSSPRATEAEPGPRQSPWTVGSAPVAASQTNPPPAPADAPSDPKASAVATTGLPFVGTAPSQAPGAPPPQTALPAGWLRPQVEPPKPCPIGDVQTYAIFRAWCDCYPNHLAEAYARHGVSWPDGRDEVDRAWEARLAADPTERQQFEQLYAYYRDYYAGQPT